MPEHEKLCWVMSDGRVGLEIQSLGLAEALGLEPVVKRVNARLPWHWCTPWCHPFALATLTADSSPLEPPWPDLIICTGRQTVKPAVIIKARVRKNRADRPTYLVKIQNPVFYRSQFDLILTPRHDGIEGPNVVSMTGSIHRVTPRRLAEAAALWAPTLEHLPRPRVAVLLGGTSRVHSFTTKRAVELGEKLAAMARDKGAGLMISASRRTPPRALAAITSALNGLPFALWDGSTGENPYYGYLALADAFVVTDDSVNMAVEAIAAGKPVLVAPLKGGSPKFDRFHAALREAGVTRPFAGRLELWEQRRFDETAEVAAEVKRRLPLFHD